MDLSRREQFVLAAAVCVFLRTGQAVASRQIAEQPGQRLSAASIRNVMARLEELGLLCRPHSSAGCIPTDGGLRTYLDAELPRRRMSPALRRDVEIRFRAADSELPADLEWVARMTAELTSEAGVVVRPMGEAPVVESITLVSLGGNRALGVVVTEDGWVGKRTVVLHPEGGSGDLQALSGRATNRFRGLDFVEVCSLLSDPGGGAEPFEPWEKGLLLDLFSHEKDGEVQVMGTENLIEHEAFSEVGRIRSVLRVLEDRPGLAGEWRRALRSKSTRVLLGSESELTAGGNLGMVATLFYQGDKAAGAVGVVGPRRMDYGRIVQVVECIGETLSRYLDPRGGEVAQ